jgi:hypothetical protein
MVCHGERGRQDTRIVGHVRKKNTEEGKGEESAHDLNSSEKGLSFKKIQG